MGPVLRVDKDIFRHPNHAFVDGQRGAAGHQVRALFSTIDIKGLRIDDAAWARFREDRQAAVVGNLLAQQMGTRFAYASLASPGCPAPIINFQTLVASKAVRVVLAADGRSVMEFGTRRAHGAHDPATLACDVGITRARRAACELRGALAIGVDLEGWQIKNLEYSPDMKHCNAMLALTLVNKFNAALIHLKDKLASIAKTEGDKTSRQRNPRFATNHDRP